MADVEKAREGAMWVVVLAAAVLAAARFATYLEIVRLREVAVPAALAWWSTYAIGVGLVVVGLFGQRTRRPGEKPKAWGALLVGILVLVLMPAQPASIGALGLLAPAWPN